MWTHIVLRSDNSSEKLSWQATSWTLYNLPFQAAEVCITMRNTVSPLCKMLFPLNSA